MKKTWTHLIARVLTAALILGTITSFQAATAEAAANKALQMTVSFNGKNTGEGKDNDAIWNANNYSMFACYKNAAKISSKIRLCGTVYIPKKALSKAGSEIHVNPYLDVITNNKAQDYVGYLGGRYTVIVSRNNKKVVLNGWDEVKQKDCSISKYAKLSSYNSKYYKLTYNFPVQSKLDLDGKKIKINTGKKYRLVHGTSITGLATKQKNISVYTDDLTITSGSKTLGKITFNRKDYLFFGGSHAQKDKACKIATMK